MYDPFILIVDNSLSLLVQQLFSDEYLFNILIVSRSS